MSSYANVAEASVGMIGGCLGNVNNERFAQDIELTVLGTEKNLLNLPTRTIDSIVYRGWKFGMKGFPMEEKGLKWGG